MLVSILKFSLLAIFTVFSVALVSFFVLDYDLFPIQKYGLPFIVAALGLLPYILPLNKKKTLLKVILFIGLSLFLGWILMIYFSSVARFPTLLACILFTAVSLRKWDEVFPNKKEVQAH